MKTFIVIAAYNEEKKIAEVIDKLHKQKYRNIIVVDDCSKDKTFDIAKRKKVYVLKHIINRGQGAALRTGIEYALSLGADAIITFDADGQHDAKEIKLLLEPLKKGKADIVLGSRFLKKSKMPLLKKIVLKGGVLFTRIFSGIKLTDTHNGFRALSRKAAEKIEIHQDRMAHASEIIDEIVKKRLRFVEVPVTITYTEYSMKKGQSIFNSINIAAKIIFRKLTR